MINSNLLSNKVALVTGASKGIGKAVALEMAERGVAVIITYNTDPDGANDVLKKIKSFCGQAYAIKTDLSQESERLNLKKEVFKITKKLDILVNNAGFFDESDGPDISSKNIEKLFSVNVVSVLRISSIMHPLMTSKSTIINISSVHGTRAKSHAIAYSASKSAVNSLTVGLAQAYAPIRVNSISPGPIETPMWGNDKKLIEKIARTTLLNRFGEPEEIAKLVAFLASEDSSYITGANIAVDGGSLIK